MTDKQMKALGDKIKAMPLRELYRLTPPPAPRLSGHDTIRRQVADREPSFIAEASLRYGAKRYKGQEADERDQE